MSTTITTLPPAVMPAVIKDVPITFQHPPPDLEKSRIHQPGMPRASRAVSKEKPEGSEASPPNASVLMQHCLFFDRDGDGVIWPWDTFVGFRRLGFNFLISAAAPFFIHASFSYPTLKGWIPHPLFPIYLDRVHRTKHGSDTGVYDHEGRFIPFAFEEIFSKFDRDNKGGLSWNDIQEMVYSNMNVMDPAGWIAERLEWYMMYLLCKDDNGIVSKEKIRAQYDGTLWPIIAAEVEAKKQRAEPSGVLPTMVTDTIAKVKGA